MDDYVGFKGFFGVYSEEDEVQVYGYVHDGAWIGLHGSAVVEEEADVTGTIAGFTEELDEENYIDIEAVLTGVTVGELVGKTIFVENDGERNAAYLIRDATSLGGGMYRLDIGDITLIRSYVDDENFNEGFVYDIAENANFRIPLTNVTN